MAQEARVIHLQRDLVRYGMFDALRALNWMLSVMNADNGYKRHDGSHYYYHLVDATQDLLNHGIRDEATIIGCILHDSEEDIPYVDNEMIQKTYGREVALLVSGVTKKEGVNYKEPENMQDYLDNMLGHVKMCLIKTADRKHNFSTLGNSNDKFEIRQALETERLFLPFFKEARKRYPDFSAYFHSAKTTIVPHLNRIKKAHNDVTALESKIAKLEQLLKEQGVKR